VKYIAPMLIPLVQFRIAWINFIRKYWFLCGASLTLQGEVYDLP
jgi:hypothetical protein